MSNTLQIDCRTAGRDLELNSILPKSTFAIRTHGAPRPLVLDAKWTRTVMNEVVVVASSVADLKNLQLTTDSFGSTKSLRLIVAGKVPGNLLSPPPGIVDGRYALETKRELKRTPIEHTELYVKLAWQVPLRRIIAACLSGGGDALRRTAPKIRIGLAPNVDSRWAFGDNMAKYLPASTLSDEDAGNNPGPKPEVDVLLTPEFVQPLPRNHPPVLQIRESAGKTWQAIVTASPRLDLGRTAATDGNAWLSMPPVDTDVINPVGFSPYPANGECSIKQARPNGQEIVSDNGSKVLGHLERSRLNERLIAALRTYTLVNDHPDSHMGPAERATFLIDAAAAGIPVVPHSLDLITQSYLSRELRDVYANVSHPLLQDRLLRESFVASAHRAAYRNHGDRNVMTLLMKSLAREEWSVNRPTVSVLIPSKRPDFISNAIEQLARQSWPHIQPIFGFHGFTKSEISEVDRARLSAMSAMIHEATPNAVFGDVMNTMTEMADGSLIAKMDDDDWYGEYHLEDLVHAHEYSRAAIVGSGVQFVYLTKAGITVRRSTAQAYKYGGHPGGPTILLARDDLRSVGNWARVNRAIDTALADAIAAAGGSVYQGNPLNFLFNKRASGHTWNASQEYFLRGKIDQWAGLRPPPGFSESAGEQIRRRWSGASSSLVGDREFILSCKPDKTGIASVRSDEIVKPSDAFGVRIPSIIDPYDSSVGLGLGRS